MNIFEIIIQRKSKESYPVVAELKQPGVPLLRTEGTFQLSSEDLDELYGFLEEPKDYGNFLSKKLFQGEVRDAFFHACGKSPKGLRILLFIEAEDIQLITLRWERLCVPKNVQEDSWNFFRLEQKFPFSLYIPASIDWHFPPIGKRDLRALVLAGSPKNLDQYHLDDFNVEKAVSSVREALGEIPCDVLASSSEKIPKVIGPPTLDELCRQLTDRRKQYTLLHFICHGRLLEDGDTALYLANNKNQVEVIEGKELIQRLKCLQRLPRFAFLSTCESASPEAEGALGGLGQRLVWKLGMPAVIAMTGKVTVETAFALNKNFYQQLRESGYVDLALTEATASLMGRKDIIVPALFSRLGGLPLFSDNMDRDLTNAEIKYGLERFQTLFEKRAPILEEKFNQQAEILQNTLETDINALSSVSKDERKDALSEIKTLCQEVTDISFNALTLDETPPNYDARCPFLGLYPFRTEADREFFFGREALIKELQQELTEHQILTVVGSSGCGKSSIVLAGVVPRMQSQYPGLKIAYLTPSSDPVAQLTTAQTQVENQAPLFVVDQFEELFTLCTVEKQRQQFIEQLLNLSKQQFVIITMRADFWGECAPYDALKTQMKRQFLIESMNTEELRRAMEQQAAKVGLKFEADLSNTILDEVKEEPGAMPLLQHGLKELWKRRHGHWLKIEEYRQGIGGIKEAIAKTADDFYNQLSLPEKNQFKNIFIRLTHLDENVIQGEEHRDTRQRVGLEELMLTNSELSETKKLVKNLADARLVITSVNPVTHREEVEVSHEALIRHWPRLKKWLKKNRSDLQLRETIRQAALVWQENEKKEDFLVHKGVRLEDAKGLAQKTGFLNQLEANYVKACVALTEKEKMEKEEQQRRELVAKEEAKQQAEKRAKLFRRGSVVMSALLVIALGVGIVALDQKQEAKEQRDEALETQSRFLTDLSRQETKKGNATVGVLLALEALPKDMSVRDRPYVPEAGEQLYKALLNINEFLILEHNSSVIGAAFSPDGNIVTTLSISDTYSPLDGPHLWDIHTGKLLKHELYFGEIVFSPDGKRLLIGNSILEIYTGKLLKELYGDFENFSPDRQTVITKDFQTAFLWDTYTGKLLQKFNKHDSDIKHAAFSLDGNIVAIVSNDNTVFLWNIHNGKLLWKLKEHYDDIDHVTLSADEKTVAIVRQYHTHIWDINTGKLLKKFEEYEYPVSNVAFNPDGKTMITVAGVNIYILEVQTYKLLNKLHEYDIVKKAAFSPDGNTIVTVSWKHANLWDAHTGEHLQKLEGHDSFVNDAMFSPDGKIVITVSHDKTARLWKNNNVGKLSKKIEGHELNNKPLPDIEAIEFQKNFTMSQDARDKLIFEWLKQDRLYYAEFSPDGKMVVTASKDKTAIISNASSGQLLNRLEHEDEVTHAAFSPNGNTVVTTSDRTARLWNVHTGELLKTLEHEGGVYYAAFSPDGKTIATKSGDNIARIWNAHTGKLLHKLEGHDSYIYYVAFSPDGKTIVTASEDHTANLWNAYTGKYLKKLEGHHDWIGYAEFSPDGKTVITASADQTACLWDSDTGELLNKFEGHNDHVAHATFSPDGKVIITSSHDSTARLWDIHTGELLNTFEAHNGSVNNARFSPDGKIIVTASSDSYARLWDVNTGKLLRKLEGHYGSVNYATFSPDGKTVLTAGWDNTARLWFNTLYTTQELIDYANKAIPICLTSEQRQQFFLPNEGLIKEGESLAGEGKIETAIVKFKEAKKLASCLKFDPEYKARRIAVEAQIGIAETLLNEEKFDEAIIEFNLATKIDNHFNGLPLVANQYMKKGDALANKGKIKAAIAKYQQAQRLDSSFAISSSTWDTLCWNGSLYEQAALVIEFCEKAVAFAPKNKDYRKSRGLALALTGNTQAAIEDFQFFVEQIWLDEEKQLAQDWIDILKKGENPFTKEVLEGLRN